MRSRWKAVLLTGASLALMAAAVPAMAGIPDVTNSFYVPQSQLGTTVSEGTAAVRFFRMCPNNDGGASLPQNARVKVVVRDVNNNPIPNVAAADICILLNGGTAAQGFSGPGADSVIANSSFNSSPLCPDVRCIVADAPTDVNGAAFITLGGALASNPGIYVRDANRKWGHYDSELPVYVLGFKLSGRLTSVSANGSYILRVKNFDWTSGLTTAANAGEAVTSLDFNGVSGFLNVNNTTSYWKDFDSSGAVTSTDFNSINLHTGHNCGTPNNP